MALRDAVDAAILRKELNKTIRELNRVKRERVNLERVITDAAAAAFSSLEPPKTSKPKVSKRGGEEVAVVMTADWQFGKVTPDYNSDVCEERLGLFAERVARLVEIQRADHTVKKVQVWALGDLVEGEHIFPGQEYHIDASLVDQVVGQGARIFRQFLTSMLTIFEEVEVLAVPGNHGRIGGLRSNVFHPDTNADRMLYLVTKQWFEATGELDKRISFLIPRGKTQPDENTLWGEAVISDIGGYRTLLIHGQQLAGRGGGGGIAGLPYPSFAKKVLGWRDLAYTGMIPDFKDVAIGHWHTHADIPINSTLLRIAGSPESYNVWAQKELGRGDTPSQRIMFVHPKRGHVTNEYRINLS